MKTLPTIPLLAMILLLSTSLFAQDCNGLSAMADENFKAALNTISKKDFEEDKLKISKQLAHTNCLSTKQIVQVCKLFGYEESKLDFAKFAYTHCTDPGNYIIINDVFSFSSSVDELTEYIEDNPQQTQAVEWTSEETQPHQAPTDRKFKVGDRVEVEYGFNKNAPATIIEVGENKYNVQFDYKPWGKKWYTESEIRKL